MKPEAQDWINELKTTAEEKQEKEEAFFEKLRQRKNSEIINDLKY